MANNYRNKIMIFCLCFFSIQLQACKRQNNSDSHEQFKSTADSTYLRCVLLINKFSMNYLCLLLPLSGIFPSKSLERSPLRPFGLESKSARK